MDAVSPATEIRIALIGDYDPQVTAHQAIPVALGMAAEHSGLDVQLQWLATDHLHADTPFETFDGFWCVPASPYRNMDGALRAIRFAREHQRPFLGTCGGFQHAVLEYAAMYWLGRCRARRNRPRGCAGLAHAADVLAGGSGRQHSTGGRLVDRRGV